MFAQIGVRSPSVQSEVTFQWEEIQGINFDGDTDAVESTNGAFPLKVTIKYFSGGELNNTNNDDVDYIEYNNN